MTTGLYPEIEPYERGLLEVGHGNLVYWETCGNPRGKPAVFLHGGPGSGCTEGQRRLFDPAAYRIVLFDQRGCGRSTPHASAPDTDLASNNTQNLIADLRAAAPAPGGRTAGWCSADPGAAPWRSPTPRRTRIESRR